MTELVRYDQARHALAECVRIDEAAEIRDRSAALAAYARQRDDKELEVWVREIQLRACVKIGELSRELDRANGRRTDITSSTCMEEVMPTKADVLASAGISHSAAHNYEQLAGGRDEQAQASGKAAMESYFAKSRAAGDPPTMDGLRGAVRGAIVATLGEPPPKEKAASPPVLKTSVLGADWVDWTGAIQVIAQGKFDLPSIADRSDGFVPTLIAEAQRAADRLSIWLELLEKSVVYND